MAPMTQPHSSNNIRACNAEIKISTKGSIRKTIVDAIKPDLVKGDSIEIFSTGVKISLRADDVSELRAKISSTTRVAAVSLRLVDVL